MRRTPKPLGELALIDLIRRRAASKSSKAVRLGIGDDCAILRPPPNHDLLVTTDFSLESRHFRRDWHSAKSSGHRTLARGLSDLAAMGATPLAAFLSLAIPKSLPKSWIDGFLDGLLTLAAQFNVPLAGGDTSESPSGQVLADIILLGSAPRDQALRRSTARPGDLIYVTGALGGAATELNRLQTSPRRFSRATADGTHPHLFPEPRIKIGQTLRKRHLATACIDVSDGLSTDLAHLCTASNVAAEIDAALLPAHPLTTELPDREQITAILHGGEDYELLFTAGPSTRIPHSIANTPITCIGRMLKPTKSNSQMTILANETRFTLQPHGFQHLT